MFRWLQVRLQKYGENLLFTGFEIGFTALLVLFLEYWRLFCVDWRYSYQDTGKNFHSPDLKLGLQDYPLYF